MLPLARRGMYYLTVSWGSEMCPKEYRTTVWPMSSVTTTIANSKLLATLIRTCLNRGWSLRDQVMKISKVQP